MMLGKLAASSSRLSAIDEAVSVKCRDVETAQMLIDIGRAERASYFHRSWVRIPLGSRCTVQEDELAERLLTSYRVIRAALPKRVQGKLD